MARFFFNVRLDTKSIRDEDGQDFADPEAARVEAIEGARDILADAVRTGRAASLDIQIEVIDESGATVLIMPVGRVTGTPTQS